MGYYAVFFQCKSAHFRQAVEQENAHSEAHLLAGGGIDECLEDTGKTRRPHATETSSQGTELGLAEANR